MADKTIVATIALAVACPEKSIKDAKGRFTEVALKHLAAGTPVTLAGDEADALIVRGVAKLADLPTDEPVETKKTK